MDQVLLHREDNFFHSLFELTMFNILCFKLSMENIYNLMKSILFSLHSFTQYFDSLV